MLERFQVPTYKHKPPTDEVKEILIKAIEDVRADKSGFGIQWRELVALDNRTKEIRQTMAKEMLKKLDTLFGYRSVLGYGGMKDK